MLFGARRGLRGRGRGAAVQPPPNGASSQQSNPPVTAVEAGSIESNASTRDVKVESTAAAMASMPQSVSAPLTPYTEELSSDMESGDTLKTNAFRLQPISDVEFRVLDLRFECSEEDPDAIAMLADDTVRKRRVWRGVLRKAVEQKLISGYPPAIVDFMVSGGGRVFITIHAERKSKTSSDVDQLLESVAATVVFEMEGRNWIVQISENEKSPLLARDFMDPRAVGSASQFISCAFQESLEAARFNTMQNGRRVILPDTARPLGGKRFREGSSGSQGAQIVDCFSKTICLTDGGYAAVFDVGVALKMASTVSDLIKDQGRKDTEAISASIRGVVASTCYAPENCYRILGLSDELTVTSTFEKNGEQVSFENYYIRTYNRKSDIIRQRLQRDKKMVQCRRANGVKGGRAVFIAASLLDVISGRLADLSEESRQLLVEKGQQLRPGERWGRTEDFVSRMSDGLMKKELEERGLRLDEEPLKVDTVIARGFDAKVCDRSLSIDEFGETTYIKNRRMHSPPCIGSRFLVATKSSRGRELISQFMTKYQEFSREWGWKFSACASSNTRIFDESEETMADVRIWLMEKLNDKHEPRPEIIFFLIEGTRSKLPTHTDYTDLKKICFELSLPSQVLLSDSITQKRCASVLAKLSPSWTQKLIVSPGSAQRTVAWVVMPPALAVCGNRYPVSAIAVSTFNRTKQYQKSTDCSSTYAMTATVDQLGLKVVSTFGETPTAGGVISNLDGGATELLTAVAEEFQSFLPKVFIILRVGISDGQIQNVVDKEVAALRRAVLRVAGSAQYYPAEDKIVVTATSALSRDWNTLSAKHKDLRCTATIQPSNEAFELKRCETNEDESQDSDDYIKFSGPVPKGIRVDPDFPNRVKLTYSCRSGTAEPKHGYVLFYTPQFVVLIVNSKSSTGMNYWTVDRNDAPRASSVVRRPLPVYLSGRTEPLEQLFVSPCKSRIGMAHPVAYTVVQNEARLGHDLLAQFILKLCHMWFNQAGAVKLPSIAMHTKKLAEHAHLHYGEFVHDREFVKKSPLLKTWLSL